MTVDPFAGLQAAFDTGLSLDKCRSCACMAGALADLELTISAPPYLPLTGVAGAWRQQMLATRYECLGCDLCFAALASNALSGLAPLDGHAASEPTTTLADGGTEWPPVPGEYYALGRGADRPLAITTLGSPELALAINAARPSCLSLVGKTETENVGIEKLVLNLLATPEVRVLILAGRDSAGHRPGDTLLALARSGVDGNMRVIGSSAPRPVLKNLTPLDVERFCAHVQVVDMVGCEDWVTLVQRAEALASEVVPGPSACGCGSRGCAPPRPPQIVDIPDAVREAILDPSGYFVIIVDRDKGVIWVEHYDYENLLLRTLRGTSAKGLCQALLAGGWVSRMDHAAYLGRELTRAEAALQSGAPFFQDGA